jgi:hypothetical protein
MQLAKAGSAVALPKQEKKNIADLQWTGFV